MLLLNHVYRFVLDFGLSLIKKDLLNLLQLILLPECVWLCRRERRKKAARCLTNGKLLIHVDTYESVG